MNNEPKNACGQRIRDALRQQFSTVRFSVRRNDNPHQRYFWISWEYGPSELEVEQLAAPLAETVGYRVLTYSRTY
jgi:hypothetical protein